jgi:hypothetical protein
MNAAETSPAPPSPSPSDQELMRQLAAGRQNALGSLHDCCVFFPGLIRRGRPGVSESL